MRDEVQHAREMTLAAHERDPELKKKAGAGLIAARRKLINGKRRIVASLRTPDYREASFCYCDRD